MKNRYRPRVLCLESRDLLSTLTVGPGQQYTSPEQVPWSTLPDGTEVDLLWQAQAYHSKIDMTKGNVSLVGLPGPQGQLPVIDGAGAHENTDAGYFSNEITNEGLITVAPVNYHNVIDQVLIQGLELEGANQGNSYTDYNGVQQFYQDSGAAVALYIAQDITIKDCSIHDNGNGIFGKSFGFAGGDLVNVHVVGNTIQNNGVAGDGHKHGTYLEGWFTVYEFNHYGADLAGAAGVQLKDRGVGTIIRYNYFDSSSGYAATALDLVDPEDGAGDMVGDPAYGTEWVYGNVLVGALGQAHLVHFGFDTGINADSQKTLYFYDNTCVIASGGYYANDVLQVNNTASVYVFDNIMWRGQGGLYLVAPRDTTGNGPTMYVGSNLVPNGFLGIDGPPATIVGWENLTFTADPGWVNPAGGDYRLQSTSPAIGLAKGYYDGTFHDGGLPVAVWQWDPEGWIARLSVANVGAIETDPAAPLDPAVSWYGPTPLADPRLALQIWFE